MKSKNGKRPVWIRINGIGHAFSREVGCDCERCLKVEWSMNVDCPGSRTVKLGTEFQGWDDPPWRAHTSASLLISDEEGAVSSHLLVDAGAGVGDSLACSRLEGIENVDGILLTHWHPDHALGLNQIMESLKRTVESIEKDYIKIPVYCTLKTYDTLRERGFSFELGHRLRFQEILPGVPFVVQAKVPITITPISVTHGSVKGAVIYVAEVEKKKTIFGWDVDVPDAGNPTNFDVFKVNLKVLKKADLLLMEANTWSKTKGHSSKPTGHTSYLKAKKYISLIRAKKTLLVHLSGHEDGKGKRGYGWTDSKWEKEVKSHWSRGNRSKSTKIGVARQGMLIHL